MKKWIWTGDKERLTSCKYKACGGCPGKIDNECRFVCVDKGGSDLELISQCPSDIKQHLAKAPNSDTAFIGGGIQEISFKLNGDTITITLKIAYLEDSIIDITCKGD